MRSRRRSVILAAVAAAALATAGCTAVAAGPSSSASSPSTSLSGKPTPTNGVSALLVQPVQPAQVVPASDGRNHVEYDLLVVNAFGEPVTLTDVIVSGPEGNRLLTVTGRSLAAATQSLYTHAASPVVAASAAVIVEVDLALPSGAAVPARVSNRIDYSLPAAPDAMIVDDTTVQGPTVDVDRTHAVRIESPLAGKGWLATSACCSPNVHRDLRLSAGGLQLTTSETFAVDWALARGDRIYDGAGSTNEQFYGFGAPVLAVADGTVVATQDGIAESVPFTSSAPETKEGFGGNSIMLKVGNGVYAFYGHLQTGSIAVHVGEKVKAGQVLGKLGNTGPSQGPHLHFGLLDSTDAFTGTSLPFVITKATLTGTVDFASSAGDTLAISPESRALKNVYPLYGTIMDFR
ncbi:M23 family metallopeptidase [Humibacter antri]